MSDGRARAGWVPVNLPMCQAAEPFACVQGWLATAGAALALANVLYAAVYGRVSGGAGVAPGG